MTLPATPEHAALAALLAPQLSAIEVETTPTAAEAATALLASLRAEPQTRPVCQVCGSRACTYGDAATLRVCVPCWERAFLAALPHWTDRDGQEWDHPIPRSYGTEDEHLDPIREEVAAMVVEAHDEPECARCGEIGCDCPEEDPHQFEHHLTPFGAGSP